MKKKMALKLLSSFLSFLIALFMIIIIFSAVSVNNKAIFGYRFFTVVTGSMTGTIDKGEFIITKKVDSSKLKVDDIITFISSDEEIYGQANTHRIIGIQGDYYTTKGDANLVQDSSPVPYDHVIGKVIFHSKSFGFVIRNLSKPPIMFLFIFVPVAAMAVSEFISFKNKLKLAKNEDAEDELNEQQP